MKANELRLGNWVYDEGDLKTPIQIVRLEEDNTGWLKPIPLTEEWLLKFGAEENILRLIDDMWIQFEDGEWCVCNDNDGFYDVSCIKHVHQLQNLYFALTGEELKIEE